MTLKEQFTHAADDIKNLKQRPSNDELLELYALFKQGSVGDVQGARPAIFDIKGRKKYDSWAAKKAMPAADAMSAYLKLVASLQAKYS